MQQTDTTTKGFFTFAQNNNDTDYVRLAYGLALSLKASQSQYNKLSIGITPGTVVDDRYVWAFDQIIEIPWGDQAADSTWKLENEWKAPWMSPYDETIKLDADMLFFSDISSWWEYLSSQSEPLVFANTVLDYRGHLASDDYYRQVWTVNNLPNIYSAFTYFRKDTQVFDFFNLSKIIYWNWEKFFENHLVYDHRPEYPSTDVIFAIAAKILDADKQVSYMPKIVPTFTHMKTRLQGWTSRYMVEDWRVHIKSFLSSSLECRIGYHRQLYPLHYTVKDWLTDDMIESYERYLTNV